MSITVSAVIPAYNAGKYLARAIDSVLAQSRPADEIIVVDDGSTDDTAAVAQTYGDRIRFIKQPNAGASTARNTGIKAAKSDWIAFLDADDEWLPQKLELQTKHLQRNPKLNWTNGNFVRCHCSTGQTQDDLHGTRLQNAIAAIRQKEYFDSYFDAYRIFAKGCTDTMLIKKKTLIEAGLFRADQRRINDYDMWLKIAYLHTKMGFLFEPLAIAHRDVPESIVKKHTAPEIIREFISRHLNLSTQANCIGQFKPCAAVMLGGWMNTLLAEHRGKEVRSLLSQFSDLYSGYFKTTLIIKSFFPRAGQQYDRLKARLLGSGTKTPDKNSKRLAS